MKLKNNVPCTGMLSATASLGLILLWDVDGGLIQIDKYLYSSEDYIKVRSRMLSPGMILRFERHLPQSIIFLIFRTLCCLPLLNNC